MKVQEGDYVDVSGMNEAERREVVRALLDCGVAEGEGLLYAGSPWRKIGMQHGGVFYCDNQSAYLKGRKLTLSDLRGGKVVLRAGDYVSLSGMSESEYNSVYDALKGATKEGAYHAEKKAEKATYWRLIGLNSEGNLHHWDNAVHFGTKTRLLTIEQVLGTVEPDSTTWDGEGLPPVGCEVECSYQGCNQGVVRVVFHSDEFSILFSVNGNHEQIGKTKHYTFSVIKTQAQKLSEAASIKLKAAQRVLDAGYAKVVE